MPEIEDENNPGIWLNEAVQQFRRMEKVCALCPPGRFSAHPGAGQCLECDSWSYQGSWGSTFCFQCPAHSRSRYSRTLERSHCLCEPGYYGTVGGPCSPCPDGALCPGGEMSYLPLAAPGFQRSLIDNFIFLKCEPLESCAGEAPETGPLEEELQ